MIQRNAHWNEDIGEWQLKCVAYTGNNMSKTQGHAGPGRDLQEVRVVRSVWVLFNVVPLM